MNHDNILRGFYLSHEKECIIVFCIFSHIGDSVFDHFPKEVTKLILDKYINSYWEKYWANIGYLKEKYYEEGIQEDYFKNFEKKKLNIEYHKTNIVSCCKCDITGKYIFTFPEPQLDNYVYKNLRLESLLHNNIISNCELRSSGGRIDKIDNFMFSPLRFIYEISDETILPFSFCKNNEYMVSKNNLNPKVIITLKPGIVIEKFNSLMFNLLVDTYQINDINYDSSYHEEIITQAQYYGEQYISASVYNDYKQYHLQFSKILNCIVIYSENNILQIDSRLILDYGYVKTKNMIHYDNKYIVPLIKCFDTDEIDGINLTRGKRIALKIRNGPQSDIIHVFAINYNVLGTSNGGIGLRYNS